MKQRLTFLKVLYQLPMLPVLLPVFRPSALPYHDQRQSLKSTRPRSACAHHPLFKYGFGILSLLTAGLYNPQGGCGCLISL